LQHIKISDIIFAKPSLSHSLLFSLDTNQTDESFAEEFRKWKVANQNILRIYASKKGKHFIDLTPSQTRHKQCTTLGHWTSFRMYVAQLVISSLSFRCHVHGHIESSICLQSAINIFNSIS